MLKFAIHLKSLTYIYIPIFTYEGVDKVSVKRVVEEADSGTNRADEVRAEQGGLIRCHVIWWRQ